MIKKSLHKIRILFVELEQLLSIRTSRLFDSEWYLAQNPDVAQAKMDPAIHYLHFGGFEGRNPSPNFSSAWYLDRYNDVKQAGINPLVHYLRYGRKEGRKFFESTPSKLRGTRKNTLTMSFLSSYVSEIGFNVLNIHKDNYDQNRFGEKKESALELSWETMLEADTLSKTLADSIRIVEPFLSRFETLFSSLADEESRNLLVKLLAYRSLGYQKVKLPLNTPGYWEGIKEIERLSDFLNGISTLNTEWALPLVDLRQKDIPVILYGMPFGIFTQFILEHYRCTGGQTIIEVKDGDFVIDAGACWGDTALYFANMVGATGKVFSFEFVPRNLDVFSRNMDLNPHLKNRITLVKNAVWESSHINVFFSDTGPGTSVNINGENVSKVETLSIDDLVALKNIPRVNFIKMDIEGSELAALRGAIKTIKAYRPKLAISVYHKFLDYLEIPEFVQSLNLGYRLYIRHFSIHAEETVLFAKAEEL